MMRSTSPGISSDRVSALLANYPRLFLTVLHFAVTIMATLGVMSFGFPFATAAALLAWCFLRDRSAYFIYPGLLLMMLLFLSPLILAGAPIALKTPPNGTTYDTEMILGIFWFIGIFSFYLSAVDDMSGFSAADSLLPKWDLVPVIGAFMLIGFSVVILRTGTLLGAGYREVTADRVGPIEYASLIVLVGLLCSRSRVARNVLLLAVGIYLASTFLVGLRLRFISVALVAFLCLYGTRVNRGWKVGGLLGGFALFALGAVRNSGFGSVGLGEILSVERMYNRGALVSTSGGAFQTSKFHAYYVENLSDVGSFAGLRFLIADIASVVTTRGGLPDGLDLKAETSRSFNVPGGGLLPGFFYAYGGIIGVLVLSVLFTALFIWIVRRSGPDAYPYKILLAAYAPRMLMYDWTVGFKMMFAFFVFQAVYRRVRLWQGAANTNYVTVGV